MADEFKFADSDDTRTVGQASGTWQGPGPTGTASAGDDAARNPGGDAGGIEQAPKKRGRKAYPRDAAGNIIRPSQGNAADPAERAGKPRGTATKAGLAVDDKVFVKNDRISVRSQIQGMHVAVAMLAKAPIFMLSDQECEALTSALCDVLDHHKINLNEASGNIGLYITLVITVFGIYKPRLDQIAKGNFGNQIDIKATVPATPTPDIMQNKGGMDFSGDIPQSEIAAAMDSTIN